MNRHELIKTLAHLTQRKNYLELGLYDGYNISQVAMVVKYAVGVEIAPFHRVLPPNCQLFNMSTDLFFFENKDKYDMIFIDADHKYKSALKDLRNSLSHLTPDGIILIHDTDPESEKYIDPGYCGDSYKLHKVLDRKPSLTYVTLPMEEAGLTIVTRRNNRRVLGFL